MPRRGWPHLPPTYCARPESRSVEPDSGFAGAVRSGRLRWRSRLLADRSASDRARTHLIRGAAFTSPDRFSLAEVSRRGGATHQRLLSLWRARAPRGLSRNEGALALDDGKARGVDTGRRRRRAAIGCRRLVLQPRRARRDSYLGC